MEEQLAEDSDPSKESQCLAQSPDLSPFSDMEPPNEEIARFPGRRTLQYIQQIYSINTKVERPSSISEIFPFYFL